MAGLELIALGAYVYLGLPVSVSAGQVCSDDWNDQLKSIDNY